MIISVSGKIGAGKDEVGNIIQYLTHCKDDDTTYEEWNNTVHKSFSKWKIKKFAYKLKQISALILGCKVEDFEDRDFKDKELGPEWDRYLLPVGWYSDIPKYFLTLEEAHKYVDKDYHHKVKKIKMTPRLFLQLVGTDAMRDVVHTNIWVNALFADYKETKPEKGPSENAAYFHTECTDCKKAFTGYKRQFICNSCHDTHDWYPAWIITDTRFPNELEAVEARNGVTIRVVRPAYVSLVERMRPYSDFVHYNIPMPVEHSSETALDNAEFDYEISNDGTIEDLIEKVKSILIEEKII